MNFENVQEATVPRSLTFTLCIPNIVVASVAHLTHVGEVLALNLVPETASSD